MRIQSLKIKPLIFLSVLFASTVSGQWTKSVSLNSGYDSNAFRNSANQPDFVNQLSGYLAKSTSGENWQLRIFYRGNLSLFKNNNERNYHSHKLGTAWSRYISGKGSLLNLGINGSLRKNGAVYNYYDFREASGYGNINFKMDATSNFVTGYKLRGRWYANLPELNYLEHYFFTRFSHSFQTRTTLQLEGNFGTKGYSRQITETIGDNWNDDWNIGGYNNHEQGRRSGHQGMGRNDNWAADNPQVTSRPSSDQWVIKARVAQSLSKSIGLSVNFLLRRNSNENVRYLSGQVSGYVSEDELFDDRYGYESEEIEAMFTQIFPWGITLKSGVEPKWKNYVNRPALDSQGSVLASRELRIDRQMIAWAGVNKVFSILDGNDARAEIEYTWIDNQSNDAYYNYQISIVTVGLAISL
jgi:hypothetical protein